MFLLCHSLSILKLRLLSQTREQYLMHPCPSSHLPTLALSTQMCGWLSSELFTKSQHLKNLSCLFQLVSEVALCYNKKLTSILPLFHVSLLPLLLYLCAWHLVLTVHHWLTCIMYTFVLILQLQQSPSGAAFWSSEKTFSVTVISLAFLLLLCLR